MMTVYDLALRDTHLSRVSSSEYAGPCPACHGQDRFHVNLQKRKGGGFMCRYCWSAEDKGWGDEVDYLRFFKGMTFQQAITELGGELSTTYPRTSAMIHSGPPSREWQEMGDLFCFSAEKCLWSAKGEPALAYLHRRGFTDETIRAARLGYCPGISLQGKEWGIKTATMTIPKGIVIPWRAGGHLWNITLRLGKSSPNRYQQILGGQECLYNADSISADMPIMLYEGVFDALSALQEAGDLSAHVATDSALKCHQARWIARIAQAHGLLIAYDADEAGEKGAAFWLKTFPQAIRWQPWASDANDMLVHGLGLGTWVAMGIASSMPTKATQQVVREQSVALEQPLVEKSISPCRWHQRREGRYEDASGAYCASCFESRTLAMERMLDLAQAQGYPLVRGLAGEEAYVERLFALSDTELGIIESALRALGKGLEGHLDR